MLQTCHNSTSRVVAKAQAAALRNFTQAKIKLRISLSGFPSSPLRFFGEWSVSSRGQVYAFQVIYIQKSQKGKIPEVIQVIQPKHPNQTSQNIRFYQNNQFSQRSHESHVDIPFIGKKLSPHPIHQLRLGHPYGPMAKSMSPWNGHHGMHVMKSTSNEPMAGGEDGWFETTTNNNNNNNNHNNHNHNHNHRIRRAHQHHQYQKEKTHEFQNLQHLYGPWSKSHHPMMISLFPLTKTSSLTSKPFFKCTCLFILGSNTTCDLKAAKKKMPLYWQNYLLFVDLFEVWEVWYHALPSPPQP